MYCNDSSATTVKSWHLTVTIVIFFNYDLCPLGGGTPLYRPYGDVRSNRVRFSEAFVLNGASISSIFVLNKV